MPRPNAMGNVHNSSQLENQLVSRSTRMNLQLYKADLIKATYVAHVSKNCNIYTVPSPLSISLKLVKDMNRVQESLEYMFLKTRVFFEFDH